MHREHFLSLLNDRTSYKIHYSIIMSSLFRPSLNGRYQKTKQNKTKQNKKQTKKKQILYLQEIGSDKRLKTKDQLGLECIPSVFFQPLCFYSFPYVIDLLTRKMINDVWYLSANNVCPSIYLSVRQYLKEGLKSVRVF